MKNSQEIPVSVHYGEDGKVDGVLLKTIDESIVISLHDADNGRLMTWNVAMKKYGDVMPSKHWALLICAYLDDINLLLEENGGESLDGWYWTGSVSEYYADSAWLFHGHYGCINTNYEYYTHGVRPVSASA